MRIGIHLPSAEIGGTAAVIADWTRAAEDTGFAFISSGEHVLGVDPTRNPEFAQQWVPDTKVQEAYTYRDEWHEPFVTMGFMAALTDLELSTSVLVSPLRRTAVLAKQAAQVDIVSGGRLRLGIAAGWNKGEFANVGVDFESRGKLCDEQIGLLRKFWTEPLVTFHGEFHNVEGAGIAPMPIQRPIPLWVGGFSKGAARRAGRLGDGWIAGSDPVEAGKVLPTVQHAAEAAGRDPAMLGIQGMIDPARDGRGLARLAESLGDWRAVGATHVTIIVTGLGFHGVEHVALVADLAKRVGLGA